MLSVLRPSRATVFCLAFYSLFTIRQAYGDFTTIINVPPDVVPLVIASDTQFNLFDGGVVESGFDAGGSDAASTNVEVNISGGSVEDEFRANGGSVVNIFGGSVVDELFANHGSVVNIFGGSFYDELLANSFSTVNISGGLIRDELNASSFSTVNVSGGTFGDNFRAFIGSAVNLFGTQFELDGLDITASLALNEPFTIDDRDVTLGGLLADGSAFAFDLNAADVFLPDFFDRGATLTVTLVSVALPGDTNGDGDVDIDDLNSVRNHFGAMGPDDGTLPGDAFPFDGLVNIDDLNAVRNNFEAAATPVPEPTTLTLLCIAALGILYDGRRGGRNQR